jgi:hypothetical protein
MASTNSAASAYFEQEFDRDPNHFCIGTCPCGNPGFLSKSALPYALECSCVDTTHTWSAITLTPALKRLVPTKGKTTKQDMLGTLTHWMQVRNDLGGASGDLKLKFMYASSPNGSPTVSGGTDDGESEPTITLIDGVSSNPTSIIRLVITNIINIAKNPIRLASFAVNGLRLVSALARGDAVAALQYIQPFVRHFAPHWVRCMNDEFMQEMGAVLQQESVRVGFDGLQKQLEEMDNAHAAFDVSGAFNDLDQLHHALSHPGC